MAKAVPVTIELSEDLLLALGRLAQVHGSLPSQELLWILHAALLPSPSLPERMARICVTAVGWVDLQHRLREEGFVLRQYGSQDLKLCSWPKIRPLMEAREAGFDPQELTLRFGSRFPSLAHRVERTNSSRSSPRLVA